MTYILVFIFGAMIGSFLNVCISRIPKGSSIVFPASHCMKCKAPIKPYDNIPLVSYLILKGKCRVCGDKIPFRYFAVELLTPIVILFVYNRFGLGYSSRDDG